MCTIAAIYVLIATVFQTSYSIGDVNVYEFGNHTENEQVSYIYNGVIYAFNPLYNRNITHDKTHLESYYTYIWVGYYNIISDVSIEFDPETMVLSFHVKFPFIDTPFGIIGYSIPK